MYALVVYGLADAASSSTTVDIAEWSLYGSPHIITGGSLLGSAVAISGDGSVVAGSYLGSANSPRVSSFRRSPDSAWSAMPGGDIIPFAATTSTTPSLSVSISADGSALAVGSPLTDSSAGAASVYAHNGATWTLSRPTIPGAAPGDLLGSSVDLTPDGLVLAAGSPGALGGNGSALVRAWISNAAWEAVGDDTVPGSIINESLGRSVCIAADGATLAAGSPGASVARAYELVLPASSSSSSPRRLIPRLPPAHPVRHRPTRRRRHPVRRAHPPPRSRPAPTTPTSWWNPSARRAHTSSSPTAACTRPPRAMPAQRLPHRSPGIRGPCSARARRGRVSSATPSAWKSMASP
jgi:hypothetical protein